MRGPLPKYVSVYSPSLLVEGGRWQESTRHLRRWEAVESEVKWSLGALMANSLHQI